MKVFDNIIGIDPKTRREAISNGMFHTKAIYIDFDPRCSNQKFIFWIALGYYLLGCDIWIKKIPVIRSMILVNIVMWTIMFLTR
jgi:hypothetical protein